MIIYCIQFSWPSFKKHLDEEEDRAHYPLFLPEPEDKVSMLFQVTVIEIIDCWKQPSSRRHIGCSSSLILVQSSFISL
jgi:hypothetical protein